MSKYSKVIANLFLHNSDFVILQTVLAWLGTAWESSPHKGIIFNSLKPWIRHMSHAVPNYIYYSDCLLILCVLVFFVLM